VRSKRKEERKRKRRWKMGEREIKDVQRLRDVAMEMMPADRESLGCYLEAFLGIRVPDKRMCEGHSSPMDYLCHSLLGNGGGDCVVWACRGGGKTMLGAVASLLECVCRGGCQVRMLGGSLEQSRRMYEHFMSFVEVGYEEMLKGWARKTRCEFANGSAVEILTQSARNVRGRHVQKLRCDEVELFDKEVLAAAKFVPQSKGGIAASMEMLSTMHRPYGLMHDEVTAAQSHGGRIFKWCLWEVIERCAGRSCSQCVLAGDCGGRAKEAHGYFKVDDAIAQMQRSSRAAWEAEMLCLRPSADDAVFGDFDRDVHVRPLDYDANLPLYRAIDFGFVNPFVCLWLQVDGEGLVRVIDEYVRTRAPIDVNAAEVKGRTPCRQEQVAATFCDPAGAGSNDVTGTNTVRELRGHGIEVRYRKSGILEGVELIRRSLRDGQGRSRFIVSPRCVRLIEALECYHYPEGAAKEMPLKDGVYDHPIDALRYFFVNYGRTGKVTLKVY
jgi:hypothetical protein